MSSANCVDESHNEATFRQLLAFLSPWTSVCVVASHQLDWPRLTIYPDGCFRRSVGLSRVLGPVVLLLFTPLESRPLHCTARTWPKPRQRQQGLHRRLTERWGKMYFLHIHRNADSAVACFYDFQRNYITWGFRWLIIIFPYLGAHFHDRWQQNASKY